jgi:hypothetical protein
MTAGSAQRAPEISDLFSFDTRRHRVVEWQAPGPVAKAATGKVRAGDHVRDPRRHPATAADGPIDRL